MRYTEALIELAGGSFDDVDTENVMKIFSNCFAELERRGVEFQCNEYAINRIASHKGKHISFD